jgi:hypothetical protein
VATWRGGATNLGRAAYSNDTDRPDRAAGRAGTREPAGDDAGAPGSEEAQYLDACVADVEAWLGTELTAYLTGADSPAELTRWRAGADGAAPAAAGRRLQTASEVVETFAAAGVGTRARAWLREVSSLTGGRSPAHLVRHARTERLLDQVREAAQRYVLSAGSISAA